MRRRIKDFLFAGALLLVAAGGVTMSWAQQPVQSPPEAKASEPGVGGPAQEIIVPSEMDIRPNEMPSILFTYWEHTAVEDARRWRGLVRPPSEEELARALKQGPSDEPIPRPPPEARDISLGGIVYISSNDWTIWLNGKRITPHAVPEEVLDLKVHNDYIEVKWFDNYTNQIFPIKLRPHQRFNIDTRIFLPG